MTRVVNGFMYQRIHRRSPVVVLVAALFAACGGGGDTPVAPADCVVSSVSLTTPATSLVVGATTQLSAQVVSSGCTSVPQASFSTSDASVATVAANGLVTAIAPGSVTIAAGALGRSGSVALTVVPVPVATVSLAPDSVLLLVGNTTSITATARDANGNALPAQAMQWASDAPAVAAISSSGEVTAIAAGQTTIRATAGGVTGVAQVVVSPRVAATVEITPASATVPVGSQRSLAVTVRDAQGVALTDRPVNWSSSAVSVATVSASGSVTAVAVGSAMVAATVDGVSAAATVTVVPVPVAAVQITPASASLELGATRVLSAVARDSGGQVLAGRSISWTSLSPAVASVSASGVVTGLTMGVATVRADIEGIQTTAQITVTAPSVAFVTLNAHPTDLEIGAVQQLVATAHRADSTVWLGRPVTWESLVPAVASVSASGLVTGIAPGWTTVRATIDGVSVSTILQVTTKQVASVTVVLSVPYLAEGEVLVPTVIVKASDSSVIIGRPVTWSSSNVMTATIANPADGQVVAQLSGPTNILASVDGVFGSAPLRVIPARPQDRVALVWANSEDAPLQTPYTPPANFTTNGTGGEVEVTRVGVGEYSVVMERMGGTFSLGINETVIVSAYGTSPTQCTLAEWATQVDGRALVATVRCTDLLAAPVNSRFTLAVVGAGTLAGQHAFLRTAAVGDPAADASRRFSSSGMAPSSGSSGMGLYELDFKLSALTRSTLVTSARSGTPALCRPTSWDDDNGHADVTCSTGANTTPANRTFTALMLSAGRPGRAWGYAFANSAISTIDVPFEPTLRYQAQSNGQNVSITRRAVGVYDVRFPGLGTIVGETLVVAPYGVTAGPCSISGWTNAGPDLIATVRCWSYDTGALANSRFVVLLLQ